MTSLALVSCTASEPSASVTVAGDDTTSTASAPLTAVEGAAALQAALEAMREGYGFESTVALDGEIVTTVSGRAGEGGIQARVDTGGAEVEYLVTTDGRWAREPGEGWLALAGDVPFSDPLGPLTAFRSVEVVNDEGGSVVLSVAYLSEALGLEGGGAVAVEILLVDGLVSRVSYASEAGERPVEVVTSFSEVGTSSPVTAPGG